MNYTCLIIDDEYMARILLKNYIDKMPDLDLIASCEHALAAGPYLRSNKIDLLFLDIQMPYLTGVEFIQTLPYHPAIIFTTASSEYAIKSYALDVIDYLLKPFSFERFVQAVNKGIQYIGARTMIQDKKTIEGVDHFFVKSSGKLVKIKIPEIDYVEGLKEYVSIYCGTHRTITLQSLKNLEEFLPIPYFIRVHKSYIVNASKIQSITGNQLEINLKLIPIGLTYKAELMKNLGLQES